MADALGLEQIKQKYGRGKEPSSNLEPTSQEVTEDAEDWFSLRDLRDLL